MGIVGKGHGGVVVRKTNKFFLAYMFEEMHQRNACIKDEFSCLKRLRLYGGAQRQTMFLGQFVLQTYSVSREVGVTMFLGQFV